MDILRFLHVLRILDSALHFPVSFLPRVVFDNRETKNRTLEEIELIFNTGAAGQVRRIFQHSRTADANYDHLSNSSGSSGNHSPVANHMLPGPGGKRHVKTSGVETSDDLVQSAREY